MSCTGVMSIDSVTRTNARLINLLRFINPPPKRETRQEPGLDIHREHLIYGLPWRLLLPWLFVLPRGGLSGCFTFSGSFGGRLSFFWPKAGTNAPRDNISPINTTIVTRLTSLINTCRLRVSSDFTLEERRGVRAALASSKMGASTLLGRCIPAESLLLIESYYNCWPDCAAKFAVLACKFIRLKLHSHRMVHRYRRNVTLRLPTLLLLSKARSEMVCSPGPTMGRSSE